MSDDPPWLADAVEAAAFYARHHRYHDPRPMMEVESIPRPCVSDETWWRVRVALRPWASALPKGWENGT